MVNFIIRWWLFVPCMEVLIWCKVHLLLVTLIFIFFYVVETLKHGDISKNI